MAGHPELDSLREVAHRFCTEVENAASASDIGFLQRTNQLLAELYWRASQLPAIEPAPTDDDEPLLPLSSADPATKAASYEDTRQALSAFLSRVPAYHHVFDPITDTEAYPSTLAGDLADIYADLSAHLADDERAALLGHDETERLWHWRWSFQNHWGTHHLLHALPAIGWLVVKYWDEEEGWSHDLPNSEQDAS